jgi:uncharacterized protein YbjT (DUF2867 family)
MASNKNNLTSVFISNADSPVGYALVDELIDGNNRQHFGQIVCTVKNVNYSGALAMKGAQVIEMKDDNTPEWLPDWLKHNDIDVFVLVPDCASKNRIQQGKNLLQCCSKGGVSHVVLLSVVGADDSNVKTAREFLELEKAVKEHSHGHCIVRHTMFEQGLYLLSEEIRNDRMISTPWKSDARCSLLNLRDLLRFISYGLAKEQKTNTIRLAKKELFKLTGPQILTANDVADRMSKVLNEKIGYEMVDRQRMKQCLQKKQMNEAVIESILDQFELINEGKQNLISQDEKQQTGKDASSFEHWIQENQNRFKR